MREESRQLGMDYGTASSRLRKIILFNLVKEAKKDTCFRCGKKIRSVEGLSIEHKQQWLDINVMLFWDMNNIAFSHNDCNRKYRTRKPIRHGTIMGYVYYHCRCSRCRAALAEKRRRQRSRQTHP